MSLLDTRPPSATGGSSAPRVVTPMRPRTFGWPEAAVLGGSAAAAAALTWLLLGVILPITATMGVVLTWMTSFVTIYWIVVRETEGRLAARDRLAAAVIGLIAVSVIVPLVTILLFVFLQGWRYLRVHQLFQTLVATGPQDPAIEGGMAHAIVGTVEQITLAAVIAVPLGILTGVYLQEIGGRMARPVRAFVQTMSGIPSIVAGLFIYSFWVVNRGFSGMAAAAALAILMLPTVTRTVEEVLRLVPGGLRESALSLGGTEWKSVRQVVLPTARAGIVTAVILGLARVVGETAPVAFTAFNNSVMNWNPFSGPQASLPMMIWTQYKYQLDNPVHRAYATAMVLLLLVLFLFVTARIVGRGRLSRKGPATSKAQPVIVEGP